jgi:hypothetical protein
VIPAVLALALLAFAPSPAVPSMSWKAGAHLSGPAPAQAVLEVEASRFAQAWGAGDAVGLGRTLNSAGIRLHLPGEEHMLIQPRQAQAALRSFMERYPGGDARVTRVSLSGGDPRMGFAEIRWRARAQGVGDPSTFTLFVAFSLEGEVWRVTEIRVLL